MRKETKHNHWCAHCRYVNVPLMKYSFNKKTNIQGYMCRDCNNAKARQYYLEKGKEIIKACINRYHNTATGRKKRNARSTLNVKIRRGEIIKPESCSVCGAASHRLEGHHKDYAKPIDVVWLCSGCHADTHKKTIQV